MFVRILIVIFLLGAHASAGAAADKPSNKQIHKVIKTVVNAIRYKKYDLAAKQVAFTPMARTIMGDYWTKTPQKDRDEIATLLETLIREVSFVKGQEIFKHLDAILYDPVRMNNGQALCKTTVVVHRKYKKQEMVIDFVLVHDGGAWKIVDTVMLGESTTEAIHEDQVAPLFDEGGLPAIMKALRGKAAELN